ncbi:hypothetical protein [Haladaptatus halobius]|uniref:hypothetical protein n=1 Tax=Haladaptatus halobius TaxID=2884875 RepID=UPI001D0B05DD|nr:hypothetical protein [Haladaptatus halobius]
MLLFIVSPAICLKQGLATHLKILVSRECGYYPATNDKPDTPLIVNVVVVVKVVVVVVATVRTGDVFLVVIVSDLCANIVGSSHESIPDWLESPITFAE